MNLTNYRSIFVAIAMLMTLCASAFEAGQTVRLTIGGRTASVKNSSLTSGEVAQIWTETNTNSQRWTLVEGTGELFYLQNVYSGLYLGATGSPANNAAVGQGSKTASKAAFDLVPVEGKKDTYIVYLGTAHRYCLAAPATSSDGGALTLITASSAPAERSEWVIEQTTPMENALTYDKRDDMMNKWRDHYYHKASTGYVIGRGGWWGDAEMFEVVLDAYETSGDAQYLTMFDNLYKNFCQRNNTDWSGNSFNDDIAWMCIACVRAYLLSGNTDYRDKAKSNFDKMYSRADKYGDGTLIWCQNWEGTGPAGTNSCINGPAAVCACYLGIATGTESYFTKAQKIYTGEREKLMEKNSDGSLTGKVWDSYDQKQGKVGNYWASSYNQGTNLGAAMMLYNHFGDPQYKKDADAIMTWTYNNMKNSDGILTACQNVTGDLAGFKAILMRYVRRYAAEHNAPKYYDWMRVTAYHAWNNRNSKGVTSGGWLTKTEENFKRGDESYNEDGVGAMGCISAAFNGHMGVNDLWNAFEPIDADRFNFIQNADIQLGDEGTRIASKMRTKTHVGFRQVDFGTRTATHVTLRARALRASTTKINIYADQVSSTKGKLLCTIAATEFANPGQWETITKELALPIDGRHDIYVQVTGTANYDLMDFNWLQFDSRSTLFADLTNLDGPLTTSMGNPDLTALTDCKATTDVKFTLTGVEDKWIQYDAQMPVLLSAYSLWSGLTASTAPTAYKLLASNDGDTFDLLDEVTEAAFTTCGQCRLRQVNPTQAYRYFRLQVDVTASSLTLSEFQLMGTGLSTLDITADGGTTTAGFEALTDHSLATTIPVPATVTYASLGNYRLASYSVTAPTSGDTLSWTLQGSTGGSTWKDIDTQTDQVVPYAQNTMAFRTPASATYSQYRIKFAGKETNVNALQLFGTLDFGTFYADAAEVSKHEERFQPLTDNDGTTTALLAGDQTVYFNSPIPLKPLGYALVPGDDPDLDPADVDIMSVSGEDSTIIVRRDLAFPLRGGRISASLTPPAQPVTDLRLKFNVDKPHQPQTSLAEVEIYATAIAEQGSEVFLQPSGITTTVDGTSATYAVGRLVDQSATTYYQAKMDTKGIILTMTFPEPQVFDTYAITAGSTLGKAPSAWILEGSNGGTSWTVLGSAQGQHFPYARTTQFYPTTQGQTAYSQYRLSISATGGNAQLMMAEWQMLNLSRSTATAISLPSARDGVGVTLSPLRVEAGEGMTLLAHTPQPTTLRFYDAQGRLLAIKPLAQGQHRVAVPSHQGLIIAVMKVGGKQVTCKLM